MTRRPDHTRLDTRLIDGLDRIATATTVRTAGTFDPDLAPLTPFDAPAPRRGRWAVIAASVTAVGGAAVGGGVLMNGLAPAAAPPAPTPAPVTAAPASPPTILPPALAPDGLMTFGRLPDELATATVELTDLNDQYPEGYEPQVTRWYTATMDAPETAPNLKVISNPGGGPFPPWSLDDSAPVTVQGLEAYLFDPPFVTGRRSVSVRLSDVIYEVSAAHLTEDELLLAAEHLRPADDGVGGVIDPRGLTNGLVERGGGPAVEDPAPHVIWTRYDDTFTDDLSLSLVVTTGPQELLALDRLQQPADITDAVVRGQPAIVLRMTEADRLAGMSGGTSPNLEDNPTYPEYVPGGARGDLTTVVWWENGHTYRLAGVGVDRDTVIAWANELQPATQAEADAMAAATRALYDSYVTTTTAVMPADIGPLDIVPIPPDGSTSDSTPSSPAGSVHPNPTTTIVLVAP